MTKDLSTKPNTDPERERQKDSLGWDLRTSVKIVDRVRASDVYAQNLYAAMCNRDFQRNDTWTLLTDQVWSCSWRSAGGIVADMCGEGDYMDWYCSGIRNDGYQNNTDIAYPVGFVAEGVVTDEIRADLFELGWLVIGDAKD